MMKHPIIIWKMILINQIRTKSILRTSMMKTTRRMVEIPSMLKVKMAITWTWIIHRHN